MNEVADEVLAVTAVVRPILQGVLYALKREVVDEVGGYQDLKLKMLGRLHRPGDGDIGICFEWAVHDAMNRCEPGVVERICDGMEACRVPGDSAASILFGAEKAGSLQLIDTADANFTPDSVLMYGTRGRPVKLRRHISTVAAAFRRPGAREELPFSIQGLWKADLFLGRVDTDKWVGSSVKVNPTALEPARGLRIGVVPCRQGSSDSVRMDDQKNLVVCPLPHDGEFMEMFYEGWRVVQAVLQADVEEPPVHVLPRPAEREVARMLVDRREFSVLEVIDALSVFAQPELLDTDESDASVVETRDAEMQTSAVVAPLPLTLF